MSQPTGNQPATGPEMLAVVGRVFTDPQFARSLQEDPVSVLRAQGVTLDETEAENLLRRTRLAADEGVLAEDELGLTLTRPAVRILTHGTQPAVSVAVSVAVETHIPHVEEPFPTE